jgi:hypothetical protein
VPQVHRRAGERGLRYTCFLPAALEGSSSERESWPT